MTAGAAIDAYLSNIASSLTGPPRTRRDIVAELRSGLLDAIDAQRSAGLTADAATEAAITEFGDPRQVADAFRPHLAMKQARGVALTLIPTGPLIGLLWALAAVASHIAVRQAPPWQWAGAPPGSPAAFPLALAAVLIAIWTGLITVAAAGPLTRWLPGRPRLAPTTAAICGLGAMAADVALFAALASKLISAPGTLAPVPVTAAALASLTRFTFARHAARRCLADRASLTAS